MRLAHGLLGQIKKRSRLADWQRNFQRHDFLAIT
jgi:hypothetical protein